MGTFAELRTTLGLFHAPPERRALAGTQPDWRRGVPGALNRGEACSLPANRTFCFLVLAGVRSGVFKDGVFSKGEALGYVEGQKLPFTPKCHSGFFLFKFFIEVTFL